MVKQQYKWNAEDYEINSKTQQKWGRELISKLDLQGKEVILDIGCGDGKLTAELANDVTSGEVIGIDSSKEMILLATKRYSSPLYPNLSFRLMNAKELQSDIPVDIVFSNAVFHWIDDHLSVLKKIFKILKPGGRVLLQMGGKGNASGVLNILSELMNHSQWKQYFKNFEFNYSFYSPEQYNSWIRDVGFIKTRVELIPKDMIFHDPSELSGWIRTTWLPYLKPIPRILQDEFIDELCDRYSETQPDKEKGKIIVKMVRLEVNLIKPKE